DRSKRIWWPKIERVPVPVRSDFGVPCSSTCRSRSSYAVVIATATSLTVRRRAVPRRVQGRAEPRAGHPLRRAGRAGTLVGMPELPEVEALAHFLRTHAVGRRVERVDVAALSVVKTFDPPISALQGRTIGRAGRAGKYLMLDCDGLFLVLHFARAGWLRWSDELSPRPVRPGRGPLALVAHLGPGEAGDGAADGGAVGVRAAGGGAAATAGFDVTEAGARKSLAAWVVADPLDVPGVARLGPDAAAVGHEELAEIVADAGGR